jgi:pimeloyl-ACP methyl ester carboxylesterase
VAAPVRLQTHVWNPLGVRRALLLHGLTSDGACWWRLASELADDGWMVLAPDLRGHGRSPAGIAYDLATLAADVALLGDGWDLLVGHSLGGAIAARLLVEVPGVRSAVLIDPVLELPSATRHELGVGLMAEVASPPDAATIRAANPAWDERDVQRKVLAATLCTPDVVEAVLADNDPWEVTDPVRSSHARIHLLAADPERGGLLAPELAMGLADGTRVTSELVTGCGHSIQRERPDVVTAAVGRVTA